MVKHVYYKKSKRPVVLGICSRKMDQQARLRKRREQDRKRQSNIRKDKLITEYIHIKYPEIYNEANAFYQTLNNKFPDKKDLRKTDLFIFLKADIKNPPTQKEIETAQQTQKEIETAQQTQYEDNMVLKIPLMSNNPAPCIIEETSDLQQNQAVDAFEPTLFDQVPEDLLQKIIDELMLEPALKNIITEPEQESEFMLNELDIDIDIPDDLLENEVMYW